MMVNSYPVGRKGMKGKHIGISTDIAIKVKEDVGHRILGCVADLCASEVSRRLIFLLIYFHEGHSELHSGKPILLPQMRHVSSLVST
jgi:hypothetical protein